MTRRSRAREVALQLLYQHDLNRGVDRSAIERFVADRLREQSLREFALQLYDGVAAHAPEINRRLAAAATNWRLVRMAAVDRNVLRIGAFELLHTPETPPNVVIDEAVDLARRFGAKDSPAFVNGVLDRLRQDAAPPVPAPSA